LGTIVFDQRRQQVICKVIEMVLFPIKISQIGGNRIDELFYFALIATSDQLTIITKLAYTKRLKPLAQTPIYEASFMSCETDSRVLTHELSNTLKIRIREFMCLTDGTGRCNR
jgi:hypothetical protein